MILKIGVGEGTAKPTPVPAPLSALFVVDIHKILTGADPLQKLSTTNASLDDHVKGDSRVPLATFFWSF